MLASGSAVMASVVAWHGVALARRISVMVRMTVWILAMNTIAMSLNVRIVANAYIYYGFMMALAIDWKNSHCRAFADVCDKIDHCW